MHAEKLVLGSANFGLSYGVGKVSRIATLEVIKILRACRRLGVPAIDTAIGYGESQQVLGSAGCHGLDCITKLPGLPAQTGDIGAWVYSQVAQALLDLRQENLYGVLLHRPRDLIGPYGRELAKAMLLARDKFNIQKIGISVYEPQELLDCWKILQYDLVQLPCNVFDRRFTTGPAMAHLRSKNIEVHARSVFLQGLLLMPDISRPAYFNPWTHVFEAWHTVVETSKKTPLEVCLAFANQQRFVHKWVIGVDSEEQLLGIVNANDDGEFMIPKTAWEPFKDLPLALISPAQWSLQ